MPDPMSRRTSSDLRAALAGALLLVLAGCVMPGAPATDRTTVLGGALTLAAPKGFCVDPGSRRDGKQGSFVLWGNCAAISGDPAAPKPPFHAMLSATVGPEAAGPVEATFPGFEKFFRTPVGRAALARSGLAEDVRVVKVTRQDNLLLLKIEDRSKATGAPVAKTYWRAITGLGGHITALSVLPLAGSSMRDADQIGLLAAFDTAIRAAN
ncbi:hypothetical protein [Paenirhodobacter sp.]|uniref:hypothetical protein n=1 Tax=Paenirhodobacter sp. TaxID=1965326 RepID=UPI003D0EC585